MRISLVWVLSLAGACSWLFILPLGQVNSQSTSLGSSERSKGRSIWGKREELEVVGHSYGGVVGGGGISILKLI